MTKPTFAKRARKELRIPRSLRHEDQHPRGGGVTPGFKIGDRVFVNGACGRPLAGIVRSVHTQLNGEPIPVTYGVELEQRHFVGFSGSGVNPSFREVAE